MDSDERREYVKLRRERERANSPAKRMVNTAPTDNSFGIYMPKIFASEEERLAYRKKRKQIRDRHRGTRRAANDYISIREGLTKIGGRYLMEKNFKAFEMYFTGSSIEDISKEVGYPVSTIRNWMKAEWWKELYNEEVAQARENFYQRLSGYHEKIFEAYQSVIEGTADHKIANAKVSAVKLFMESGDNPLIKKRHNLTVNNTVKIGSVTTLDMAKMKNVTPENLLEMARTGIIPEELVKK